LDYNCGVAVRLVVSEGLAFVRLEMNIYVTGVCIVVERTYIGFLHNPDCSVAVRLLVSEGLAFVRLEMNVYVTGVCIVVERTYIGFHYKTGSNS
jgi:DNA-binding GntR family transcriptional regulator